jgi:4-hydroxybenzoate polyprenyltransferase
LFLGCVAWVIGYDTIYALQDIEDDAIVGVRSTARLFGDKWRNWVYAFYAIAFALWIIAARVGGAHWLAPALLVGLALLCSGQLERTNAAEPQSALAAFKANVPLGIAIAFIFILAAILGE